MSDDKQFDVKDVAGRSKATKACSEAYLWLLTNMTTEQRIKTQWLLCHLRDAIVEETGADQQQVQEAFEESSLLIKLGQEQEPPRFDPLKPMPAWPYSDPFKDGRQGVQ